MKLSEFDFDLPEELIATRPARPRSSSRLLVATQSTFTDTISASLPDFLRPGDRLILNDTKVLPARLRGNRHRRTRDGEGVASIELTLLEPRHDGQWSALLKPMRKIRIGEQIDFGFGFSAELVAVAEAGQALICFNVQGAEFDSALNRSGAMPLPPYIASRRPADERDKIDYQTMWAKNIGAVAAPTASLHFDEPLMAALKARGVDITYVTLHVGAGTFLPVKVDDISEHRMHAERGTIDPQAAAQINATRESGGRIIPVGTTSLRLIESAAAEDGSLAPWTGSTDIFITPGYSFRVADGLMTNFHLPRSTLMMLVSALMGTERVRQIYDHAISESYRFFSYGDSSLLLPED